MLGEPQRDPARLLRFALRCGDHELTDLLTALLRPDLTQPGSPLAARTYLTLEAWLGIAPTH